MTQAANCGSTPAALNRATDLNTISGLCGATVSAVAGGSTGLPGFQGGSNSGSGTAGGTGIFSGGMSVYRNGLGLIWSIGIMAAMAIGILG
ncbi:hypothetical protein B0T16DRAFT_414518 [Cercophora newfieldiana]|uniref:Uncharacterized protein n=1 Tax=Cercophora newfieldiana TaxID=92897 RepID=A0AA40CRN5_9PEZI|nr:hypothetical protein B0T16DRAFT_414518 [Cercophora newfieldiana]